MAAVEVQEIRAQTYVGFDSITQQIEHKLLKRGFQFNVIVVGALVMHTLLLLALLFANAPSSWLVFVCKSLLQ